MFVFINVLFEEAVVFIGPLCQYEWECVNPIVTTLVTTMCAGSDTCNPKRHATFGVASVLEPCSHHIASGSAGKCMYCMYAYVSVTLNTLESATRPASPQSRGRLSRTGHCINTTCRTTLYVWRYTAAELCLQCLWAGAKQQQPTGDGHHVNMYAG